MHPRGIFNDLHSIPAATVSEGSSGTNAWGGRPANQQRRLT